MARNTYFKTSELPAVGEASKAIVCPTAGFSKGYVPLRALDSLHLRIETVISATVIFHAPRGDVLVEWPPRVNQSRVRHFVLLFWRDVYYVSAQEQIMTSEKSQTAYFVATDHAATQVGYEVYCAPPSPPRNALPAPFSPPPSSPSPTTPKTLLMFQK